MVPVPLLLVLLPVPVRACTRPPRLVGGLALRRRSDAAPAHGAGKQSEWPLVRSTHAQNWPHLQASPSRLTKCDTILLPAEEPTARQGRLNLFELTGCQRRSTQRSHQHEDGGGACHGV